MTSEKRNAAAPCGIYCGACMVYRVTRRGDSEHLQRMKEQYIQRLSDLEAWKKRPGAPPPAKNFDCSRLQKEAQEGTIDLRCNGCLSDVAVLQCQTCGFRECAQEKGLTSCSQCPDMPCQWLLDFSKDGLPHHSEVLISLERQKKIGIDGWINEQEERWRCTKCGSPLSWYDTECPECHAAQTHTYTSSPFPR